MTVPFNIPYLVGTEIDCISKTIMTRRLCGGGPTGIICENKLQSMYAGSPVLLTTSCTDALEICAALLEIRAGDEVIAPSFTFVSTVNPFVIRGARIRFVDVEYPSLNVSPLSIEAAITPATKAVIVVHYGGGSSDISAIRSICDKYGIILVEDAAQSIMASFNEKPLGTFGHLGCLSFHETKNIHCGEGGALIVNDRTYLTRAEIIREKGTDRAKFFRGQVDKYSWVDTGSSHIISELNSAFLLDQLNNAESITRKRVELWNRYKQKCEYYGIDYLRFQEEVRLNGHIFGVFAKNIEHRSYLISMLKERGIQAVFHYVPLHNTAMGVKNGTFFGCESNTIGLSERLIRLPIYPDLDFDAVDRVIDTLAGLMNSDTNLSV